MRELSAEITPLPRNTKRAVVVILLGTSSLAGCYYSPEAPPAKSGVVELIDTDREVVRISSEALVRQLGALAVKGKAPDTGYDRDRLFGDFRNILDGCGARDVILQRDMEFEVVAQDDCVVIGGPYEDPYSGEPIDKVTDYNTQIDHVVSLHDAWLKGAQSWPREKAGSLRKQFTNDPLNLRATKRLMNQKKSDADAATWLPPNHEFRCELVGRQVLVKRKYNLWVTPAEKSAIARELGKCAGETISILSTPKSLETI